MLIKIYNSFHLSDRSIANKRSFDVLNDTCSVISSIRSLITEYQEVHDSMERCRTRTSLLNSYSHRTQ